MTESKEFKHDYILGPVSLTEHWHPEYQKRVYIFGDEHSDLSSECKGSINIAEFISKTIEYNEDKTLDILLEAPLLKENVSYYQENKVLDHSRGFLFKDIKSKFDKCLQIRKDECKYKNTRFHYCDVRFFNEHIRILTQIPNFLSNSMYIFSLDIKDTDSKELLNNFNILYDNTKKLIKSMSSNEPYTFSKLVKLLKIDKQLENIESEELKEYLKQYIFTLHMKNHDENDFRELDIDEQEKELDASFITIYKDILYTVNKIKEFMEKYISIYSELITLSDIENINIIDLKLKILRSKFKIVTLNKDMNYYSVYLLKYFTPIMDYYLLARMFRKFNEKKYSKFDDEAYNIIVYVGNNHAKHYRIFLDMLGFTEVKSSRTSKFTKCLPIDNFNQPFFT